MKKTATAVLLLFLLCRHIPLYAQDAHMRNIFLATPPKDHARDTAGKICNVTRAGLVTVGIGFVAGVTGVGLMAGSLSGRGHVTNPDNHRIGSDLFFVGGILEIVGGGMLIAGGMHDHLRKRRISIISSKKGAGIAYNF